MCIRIKITYECGCSQKSTKECHSQSCTGITRYHFLKEGDCDNCKQGSDRVTRGRERKGRYARELKLSNATSPVTPPLLSPTSTNIKASPWAPEPPRSREKRWRSPVRRKIDDALLNNLAPSTDERTNEPLRQPPNPGHSPNALGDDFIAWLENQSAWLGYPSAASVIPGFNDNAITPIPSPYYSKSPVGLPFQARAAAQYKSPFIETSSLNISPTAELKDFATPLFPQDGYDIVDLGQRRNPFLREDRLFDLPLLLGDQEILAVPDTGAQINAISVQTLKRLRGQFQSQWGSLDDAVNVANSSSTNAICQVTIHCRLVQASLIAQYYQSCVFHVFGELASGVMAIMGKAFLDAAQILTTRSHLLRERVDNLQYIPRCMSIGPLKSSGLRLPVYLDSKLITAFPDTGSEIDLISRACALLHRFDILQLQATDKSVVQFADGQIDTLSGKVRVKFDTFTEPVLSTRSMPPTKRDEPAPLVTSSSKRSMASGTIYSDVASPAPPDHHRAFYVLDSLPYDVVLSQSLLHSIDAFNLHASGFTTVTPEENKKEICTVFWYRGKEYKAEETLQECKQREAARRTKVRLAREKIEKKIQKTPAGDTIRRDQLHQDLEELRRQNEEEKEKYDAEVQALLTSSSTREKG